MVDELQSAVVARRQVRLVYRGRTPEPSDRVVDPWGLVDKGGAWYLIAGSLRGRRTFRVDRIVSASVLEEHFERPADFDLADAWTSISSELEARGSEKVAEVVVASDEVFVLREHFGVRCTVISESGGRSHVQVAARRRSTSRAGSPAGVPEPRCSPRPPYARNWPDSAPSWSPATE